METARPLATLAASRVATAAANRVAMVVSREDLVAAKPMARVVVARAWVVVTSSDRHLATQAVVVVVAVEVVHRTSTRTADRSSSVSCHCCHHVSEQCWGKTCCNIFSCGSVFLGICKAWILFMDQHKR